MIEGDETWIGYAVCKAILTRQGSTVVIELRDGTGPWIAIGDPDVFGRVDGDLGWARELAGRAGADRFNVVIILLMAVSPSRKGLLQT